MFSKENGWTQLDSFRPSEIKDETPNKDWDSRESEEIIIETLQEKAAFYAE